MTAVSALSVDRVIEVTWRFANQQTTPCTTWSGKVLSVSPHVASVEWLSHSLKATRGVALVSDIPAAGVEYWSITTQATPVCPQPKPKKGSKWQDVTTRTPDTQPTESLTHPLHRWLPKRNHAAFVSLLVPIVSKYSRHAPDELKESVWQAFLDVPHRHLRLLTGRGQGRSAREQHLALQLLGRVLVQQPPLGSPDDTDKSKLTQRDKADAACIKRATRFVTEGKLGRAARALEQPPPGAELPPLEVMRLLQLLHPHGDNPPPFGCSTTVLPMEGDELRTLSRQMCSGAAAGVSGWTDELLCIIIQDPMTGAFVGEMIADVASNHVPEAIASRLRKCRLIAIPKPQEKGSKSAPGIRPIAVGEAVVKIATRMVLCRHRAQILTLFAGTQYGVGSPGGAEMIVHRVRTLMQEDTEHALVTATIDCTNAFNSPARSAIALAVAKHAPFLQGIFSLEYAEGSDLIVRGSDKVDRVIRSTSGTRQGSAGGGVFFSLVIHDILAQIRPAFPQVHSWAYLDDVTLMGPPAQVALCRSFMEAKLHDLSIHLNSAKCEWFGAHMPSAGWRPSHEGIKILGCWLTHRSLDPSSAAFLEAKMRKHECLFRRLHAAPAHVALPILIASGVPRVSYYCRTHEPSDCRPLVTKFDAAVSDLLFSKLECAPCDRVRRMAHLPLRDGGCGFTLWSLVFQVAHSASRAAALDPSLGAMSLQRAATDLVNADIILNLQAGKLHNRITENARKSTSEWVRNPFLHGTMTAPAYAAALRLRLAAPSIFLPPIVSCACGAVLPSDDFCEHATSCARRTGMNISTTHRCLKDVTRDVLVSLGATVEPHEPREFRTARCPGCGTVIPSAEADDHVRSCPNIAPTSKDSLCLRRRGPDLRVHATCFLTSVVLDTTTVNPCCPSYAGRSLTSILASRTATKNREYGQVVQDNGEAFVVAAVSSQGYISRDFRHFLSTVCAAAEGDLAMVCGRITHAVVNASAQTLVAAERPYRALATSYAPPARSHHSTPTRLTDADRSDLDSPLTSPTPLSQPPFTVNPAADAPLNSPIVTVSPPTPTTLSFTARVRRALIASFLPAAARTVSFADCAPAPPIPLRPAYGPTDVATVCVVSSKPHQPTTAQLTSSSRDSTHSSAQHQHITTNTAALPMAPHAPTPASATPPTASSTPPTASSTAAEVQPLHPVEVDGSLSRPLVFPLPPVDVSACIPPTSLVSSVSRGKQKRKTSR